MARLMSELWIPTAIRISMCWGAFGDMIVDAEEIGAFKGFEAQGRGESNVLGRDGR